MNFLNDFFATISFAMGTRQQIVCVFHNEHAVKEIVVKVKVVKMLKEKDEY
jgi:hypothetical protein